MHRTFFLFLSLFLSMRGLFYGADLEWVASPVSGLMSNPANWHPAQTPVSLDNLIFTGGSQIMNVTNDLGTFQLGNLTILDNYTIVGNSFELLAPPQPSALTYGQTVTAAQINVSSVNIDGATVWAIVAPPGPGATISSPITGGDGGLNLLKGKLTLSGSNTYGGSTTLSAGTTLISGSSSSLSNQSSIVLQDNATLDLNDNSSTVRALSGNPTSAVNLGSKTSTTLTLTAGSLGPMYGTLSGSGGIILNGGQLTLLGTASHTGATILQSGANLLVSNLSSVLPKTPALTFQSGGGYIEFGENSTTSLPITANGPVFIGTNGYNVVMSGPISGSGQPFAKIGSGKLTMTGANNNTNGSIQILGGVLNLNTTSLGSAGTIQFNEFSGTLQAGSDLTISNNIILTVPGTIDTNGHTMTIRGAMIDAGSFTKTGLGTLYLTSPSNTYAGQTIIEGGILNVPSASYNVPASTTPNICAVSQLVFQNDGGTFQAGSDYTSFASAIVLMGDGTMDTNSHAMTAAGVIAGPLTSTFTKAGIGTFKLNGANLYTGPTQVIQGVLQAGIATSAGPLTSSPGAFGILSDVTVESAAVLDLNGYSNTVGSLAGSGAVTLGAGTLTIGDANGQTFSGNLSPGSSGGGGGLILLAGTKTGLQIFSGTNTYTGPTLLSGGTLQAGSAGATSASSDVTVASGATLDFQSFSNSIHSLSNSGIVKSGANIASAGAFTQLSTGTITLDFPKSTLIQGGGKITANGVNLNGTLNLTNTGGASAPSPGQNIVLFNTTTGSISGDFLKKNFPHSWVGVETLISPSNPSQYILRLIEGACAGTWQQPGPGNWGVQSYWSGTCIPGIHGSPSSDTATFQGLSPSSIIVTLADDAGNPLSVVLQAINFTNASTSYTIAPSGLSTISLNSASTPQISVTAGNHTISAPIALDVSSMMTVTSGSLTLSGAVSSSDSTISLTKQGAGTLILGGTNPNTYTGPTMITEGVIQAGKSTALGSSSAVTVDSVATLDLNGFAVGAGSLSGAGNIQLGAGTLTIGNGNGQNFSGPISGSVGGGNLTLSSGTLTLSGINTYSGVTTVSGGALLAGSSSSFPSGSAFSIGAGATLNLNGFDSGVKSLAGGGSVILGSKTLTLTNASGTFSGNMTSTTGGGLVLTAGTQILSGNNTYNGPTTLNGGTLQAGSTTAFSGNSSFTIASGAILDLNSNNNTVNSLSGSGNVYLTGAGTLLTIANGASQIFSGIMSGAGGFILSSGNLTLQNANTYSGATNVSGGILTVGVANALPASSAVTVAANAELHLGQNSNTIYSLTNSGIVTTSNTITIQGTSPTGGFFTQHSESTLKLDFPASSLSSVGNISASGALNLGGKLTVTNSGGAVPSGAFSITLLQGSSPPIGTFTVGSLPFGIIQYTGNQVNLVSSGACDGVWGNSAGGNWGVSGNWTTPCIPGGTPPNPSDDTATFPNFPAVPQVTVTLANGAGSHLPVSIRNINIQGSTTSYTIQPSTEAGSLISLNSTSSMPQIYTTSGNHTIQAPISIDAPSTFNVSGLSLTLSGVVSGASENIFFKEGTGTLTFSALNTYEASMWINAGIVEANIGASGSAGAFGSNSDVLVSSGAQLHLGNFDNSVARLIGLSGSHLTSGTGTLTITSADGQGFSGIISGGGGLTLSSTATLQYLSGANTYSGATTIQGGALQALAQETFSPNSAVQLSTGTLLDLNDFDNSVKSLSGMGTVNLGTAVLQIVNGNNQTFSGIIQGVGGVTLQSGTQTLSGLTSNTYSGTTTISGGILSAGSVNILSSDSNIVMSNSGSLQLNGHSNQINGLTGATANTVDLGSGTLTIMNPTNDLFSGVISGGSGGIILNGGIQILSGQNTYGGATQINAASTLKAAAANALPSGSDVTVAVGATLDFQNFNNTIHSLTNSGNVLSQATITMGTFNQATVSPGTITLDFPTSSPYAVGNIVTTGSIALGGNLSVPNLIGVVPPPIGTHIVLFQSSGVGSQLTGSFAHTSVPSWAEVIANYATNSVYLQVIGGCGGDWISQLSSDWGISGNWSSGCIPGIHLSSNNDYANFNDLAGISGVTVTLADSTGITALPLTLQAISLQAATTSFTIRQLNSASIITLIADHGLTPQITVSAGSHTMDAPISLAQDSTMIFSGGQLTFSSSSQITSTGAFTLSLNQTANVGGLVNQGQIAPQSVALIGASLNNFGSITPPGPLSASDSQSGSIPSLLNNYATIMSGDLVTIGGSTTLNNYGVIQSTLAFVIGGTGGTPQVVNSGTLNSASSILIESGTINNNPGGSIFTASGHTMFMIGGTMNNSQGAVLGKSGADIYLAGGLLSNSGSVVSGQYTQLESAALQIGVSTSSQFGNIAASELAFLDGSLTISALPDFLMANGQSIDLITAQEGIVTPFKDIYYQNFPSFINPSVLYLPNSVRLNIQATAPPQPQPHLGGIASIAFISMHQGNHLTLLKLSQLRERMYPGRVLQPSVQSIDVQPGTPSMQERPIAVASSSEDLQTNRKIRNPLIAASTAVSLQNGDADRCFAQAQTQSVLLKEEQLRERGKEQPMQPWSVYIGPDASFGHLKSHGDQAGVGYSSAGVIGGMDYAISQQDETSNRMGFGFMGNYRATSADVQRDQGTIHADHLHANFYGTIVPGSLPDFFLETIVGYAYAWDTTKRNTGTGLTADGKTHESILNFLFGMEYQFSGNVWSALPKHFAMTPLLTVQYIVDWVDGFTESDAGAYNLRVDACTPQSVTTLLGTRIEYTVGGPRLSLHLELDMGWQREYLHSWFSVNTTAFNVVDQSTQTRIFGPGRNTLLVSGDLLMTMHRGWQIEGTCTYQLNSRFYDAFFYLGFGKKF